MNLAKRNQDQRQHARFQVGREAFVEIGRNRLSVRIVNVSAGGAFIQFYRTPSPPPSPFRLVFIGDTAETAMDTTATFVHGGTKGWGVQFEEQLSRDEFIGYLSAPQQMVQTT